MAKLKIGDTMPDFTFNTAYEDGKTTAALVKGAEKTVFWVLRYIGCTSCRYDVHLLAENYDKFKAENAQVVVVMQGEAEIVREEFRENPLPFDIICDTKQEIYKTLNIEATKTKEELMPQSGEEKAAYVKKREAITALGFAHGKYEGDEQQLPALFITDNNGKVLYSRYAKNIADMPAVEDVLALL